MIFKTPAMRLSIALVLLMVNLLFLANLIGLVPDESESALELRKGLSESLALQFSAAAEKGEFQTIQRTLRAVVERNDNIRSAAIRKKDGKLIALAGEHLVHWKAPADGKSTSTHVHVPVFRKNENWATVEIRFAPLWTDNLASGWNVSFYHSEWFSLLFLYHQKNLAGTRSLNGDTGAGSKSLRYSAGRCLDSGRKRTNRDVE